MQIRTRVIVTPRGGGEPLEIFDSVEDPSLEVDFLLATYTARFGEHVEVAWTEAPGVTEPVSLGWVFDVPAQFELPGPHGDFEMVLVPMVEVEGAGLVSLFVWLAQEKQAAEQLLAEGKVDTLHVVTLPQREVGEDSRP